MRSDCNPSIQDRVVCSPETKQLLIIDCVAEYLKAHPEMRGQRISHDKILREVVEWYLKTPQRI